VGLFPVQLAGGIFGVLMIAFFAQNQFATGSGFPALPNGLFFGGGGAALKQLGIEILGIGVSVVAVFVLSHLTVRVLAALMRGITTSFAAEVETKTGAPAPLG